MESREFVADPDRPDEGTTRWIHRPPDVPLQPLAHDGVSYPLPLSFGSLVQGDPSTSIDLQHVPQPTSLVPFQSNQPSAEPTGYAQATEAYLPEDVQQQLAEVEWQHEVARYEILEKAQAIPAISQVQEAPASYPYAAMGEPTAGYAGVFDTSNVPMRLPPIPNHDYTLDDNSSANGVGAGLWPAQQLSQTTAYPNSARDHVGWYGQQNNTFLNARDLDYNAFEHSAYGQQSSLDQMALTASIFNTMPSALSPCDQGNHPSAFMAPTQLSSSQQTLPLCNLGAAPVATSQLPTNATSNLICDATSSMPLWNGNTESSADHSSAVVVHELRSYPTINHPAVSNVEMTSTIGPQAFTGAIRSQAGRGKWRQGISTSPYATATGPGRAVDNIQFHTSPEADRHRQRTQPRIYSKRSKKVKWSCFGCRLSKKSCEDGAHGVCRRCRNILKMYSDRTVLPRFTCTVRTKLSEMSIYTDIPPGVLSDSEMKASLVSSLPRSWKLELNDGLPPLTIDDSPIQFLSHFTSRLAHHVRDLLDMLEPLHVRQCVPNIAYLVSFWSYSFSMVKWKNAICFFRPYLKDALDFHDGLHRLGHQVVLQHLEKLFDTKRYEDMTTPLNVWYQGISDMEDGPMVDVLAKKDLLDALKHRMFHIYREILPKTRGSNKARRSDDINLLVKRLSLFSNTSSLLPEEFRYCRLGYVAAVLMEHQRNNFTSEHATTTMTNHEPSLESHQQVERSPPLNPYIPSKMAVILGMNTRLVDGIAQMNQETLLKRKPSLRGLTLEFSAWTLSLVLKAIFGQYDLENGTGNNITPIVVLVSNRSFRVWELLGDFISRPGAPKMDGSIADYIMTNRDVLEVYVINCFTNMSDKYLARHGPTYKKRSKRAVQE